MKSKQIKFSIPLLISGFLLAFPGLAQAKIEFGIDVLKEDKFKSLHGARIALITNHTGVDKYGTSTVDLLGSAPNAKLICILTPEHGFRGNQKHGRGVKNSVDETTGLPLYSLYGDTTRPTSEMLDGVNTIVFDIQDVGTRFYTYVATMGMAMEQAARNKIRFLVLDRPNPIRGDIMEGDVLDADIKRLTGFFSIPVRHGMTAGEIALFYNETQKLGIHLEIIKMKGWRRSDWYERSGHAFIPPSPNIPSLGAALLYSGIGCFEATNVSVGRGTDAPFQIFGAPWVDNKALCAHLRLYNFPGVVFEEIEFTPQDDIFQGELCRGVKLIVTDRRQVRPFSIFLAAFRFLYSTCPGFKPDWNEVRVVTGSNQLKLATLQNHSWDDLMAYYQARLESFQKIRQNFTLYP